MSLARIRWALVGGVGVSVIVIDQLSKAWAVSALVTPRHLFWTLRLQVTRNPGAAFSTGTSIGPIIGIVALGVVLLLLRSGRSMVNRSGLVALGLVSGGAIGNLIDRAARGQHGFLSGHVVDFIDFQWWPVFNVADIGVVVGALLLALVGITSADARKPATEGAL